MKSPLRRFTAVLPWICPALLLAGHEARANAADSDRPIATTPAATVVDSKSPESGDGSIFAWELSANPAARETSTASRTVPTDGPAGAVFRVSAQDPQAGSEPFWVRDRRCAELSLTSATAGGAGLFGSAGNHEPPAIHFPSRGSDWASTLQFTTALAGVSLGGWMLLRLRRSDSMASDSSTRAFAAMRRRLANGRKPVREIIRTQPARALKLPATG